MRGRVAYDYFLRSQKKERETSLSTVYTTGLVRFFFLQERQRVEDKLTLSTRACYRPLSLYRCCLYVSTLAHKS